PTLLLQKNLSPFSLAKLFYLFFFKIIFFQKSSIKPSPYAVNCTNEAIILKNATLIDLFSNKESTKMSSAYIKSNQLNHTAKILQNKLANTVKIKNKVKSAGKK